MYRRLDRVGSLAGKASLPLTVATGGWAQDVGSWGDFIRCYSVSKIYVSLDAPFQSINDYIRGPNSFVRALETIGQAVIARAEKGAPIVTIVTVITRNNLSTLGALIRFLLSLRVDRWFPSYLENAHLLPRLRLRHSDLHLLKRMRLGDSLLDQVLGQSFDSAAFAKSMLMTGRTPINQPLSFCKTAGNLLTIHPNGKIYGCYGAEYHDVALIGNLLIDNHRTIIQSLDNFSRTRTPVCCICPEPYQKSIDLRRIANEL